MGTATARSRHAPLSISKRVQPGSRFFGHFRRPHAAVKYRAAQRLPRHPQNRKPKCFQWLPGQIQKQPSDLDDCFCIIGCSQIWCARQDLNLHACAMEPKSIVSANSTTGAYFTVSKTSCIAAEKPFRGGAGETPNVGPAAAANFRIFYHTRKSLSTRPPRGS